MDINEARKIVLKAVEQLTASDSDNATTLEAVIEQLRRRRRSHDDVDEQLLLTAYYDLFRTGILSWGMDFSNPDMHWAHLTEHGKKTLAQVSRDPANPKGYMAVIDPLLPKGTVARSYIEEALQTYNAGCDKATAVMVGAAAESMALVLRDTLTERMTELGKSVPKALQDWKIKTVLEGLEAELRAYTKKGPVQLPYELAERFSSFWPPFTGQLRIARNDAGHPTSVEPVTRDVVHGSLLIFPELARLAADLRKWIQTSYS